MVILILLFESLWCKLDLAVLCTSVEKRCVIPRMRGTWIFYELKPHCTVDMKSISVPWPVMALYLSCLMIFVLPKVEATYIRVPMQSEVHHNISSNSSLHYSRSIERLKRSSGDGESIEYEDDDSSSEAREMGKAGGVSDSSNGYYDFIINEGSYKFWAVFQIFTAALLIYSGFAAVYYAKYNYEPPTEDEADEDILWKRSGDMYQPPQSTDLSSQTFQRIMDALSTKKYT